MTDEHEIQQRIRYLIEHGGVYPRDRWPVWAVLLIVLGVVHFALQVVELI